jgi:3-hydroxyacyl-[acyl-carrier-protein] dehydratase
VILAGTPHRFPMLLVDRLTTRSSERARAIKVVSVSDMPFPGAHPDAMDLPHTLVVDALGQVAIMLLSGEEGAPGVWFLGSIEEMAFGVRARAGSVLQLEAQVLKRWRAAARMKVRALIAGSEVAVGTLVLSQGGSANDVV